METLATTAQQPVSSGIFIEGVGWGKVGVPAWSRGPCPSQPPDARHVGNSSLSVTLSDSVGVHSQEACAPEGGGGR